METTKEVAKKKTTAVSVFAATPNEGVEFDTSDILIPKILLMQGSSKLVGAGKAQIGDMVNSVTNEKLGDKTKGILFAPINTYKTMTVMKLKGGQFVFDKSEPWTPAHATRAFEETINGEQFKNYPTLNFFVMLDSELKKAGAMPCLISFKSTSLKAGKKVINHFATATEIGQKPCSGMLTLTCKLENNKQGQPYHAFDISFSGDTPAEYGPKLLRWEALLKQQTVKVDNAEERETEVVGVSESDEF